MLRHFACGFRNFKKYPARACVRYNWVFIISFDGKLYPRLNSPGKAAKKTGKANFYIIPPQTPYTLVHETQMCSRAVFHFAYVSEILGREVLKHGMFEKMLNPHALNEAGNVVKLVGINFDDPNALSELYYEFALLQLTFLAIGGLEFEKVNPLQNVHKERVRKAMIWYGEHLQDSPSLSDVAESVHISIAQLRRDFYGQTAGSPKEMFNTLRMQKAKRLLISTSFTLDQIGQQCGFQGASDFCSAFKKQCNVPPNQWRHDVNPTGNVS